MKAEVLYISHKSFNFKKSIIKQLATLMIVIFIFINCYVLVLAEEYEDHPLSVSEAANIVKEWEYIFIVMYNNDAQYKYYAQDEPGQRCEYERYNYETGQYEKVPDPESYIAPCYIKTYDEFTAFLEKTYTKEMAEEIMNRTAFLFIGDRIYY